MNFLTVALMLHHFLQITTASTGEVIEPRIVDGINAKIDQFPYYTIVRLNENVICGGGLFNKTWVITAAQCLAFNKEVELEFGATTLNSKDSVKMKSSEFYTHPDFDALTFHNDIALIKLPEAPKETANVKSWELIPSSSAKMDLNKAYLTITGFGSKTPEKDEPNDNVHFQTLLGIKNSDCAKKVRDKLISSQVCGAPLSNKYRHAMCSNDAGDPIVTRVNKVFRIVAIASYGQGDTECDPPTVLTKIGPYIDWIKEKTGLTL